MWILAKRPRSGRFAGAHSHKQAQALKTVTIYTDGACSGNPGPGGWAALLTFGADERVVSGSEPATTNNRMELRAVVEALNTLREPCLALVHTDSAYIANAFNDNWISGWIRRGWKTAAGEPVKNRDLWEELIALTKQHEVRFIKVRGHANDALNNRVDGLAVQALKAGAAKAR
jgi:ribonuclease HI